MDRLCCCTIACPKPQMYTHVPNIIRSTTFHKGFWGRMYCCGAGMSYLVGTCWNPSDSSFWGMAWANKMNGEPPTICSEQISCLFSAFGRWKVVCFQCFTPRFYYHSRDFDVFLQTSLWIIVVPWGGGYGRLVDNPSFSRLSWCQHDVLLQPPNGLGRALQDMRNR